VSLGALGTAGQAIVAAVEATVVVPTRDRIESLRRTLRALAAQRTGREWELVVVDDGSSPPVPEDLPDAPAGWRVIRGPGEGPARARNRGWREARGEIVLFTDDDVEPAADWLERACAYLDANPAASGVEGMTNSGPYDRLRAMSVENHSPGGFLTANLGFRRDVLRELEGFFEGFPFPHCEDYDLAFRAEALGPIGFAPEMQVLHHPREMSAAELARRGRLGASEIVLFRRHRERYGRVRRLPAVAFPFVNALVEWTKVARSDVRSPRDAIRWLRIFAGYVGHLARQAPRYARRQRRLT
jgi:GT2 family glycosyltransferase